MPTDLFSSVAPRPARCSSSGERIGLKPTSESGAALSPLPTGATFDASPSSSYYYRLYAVVVHSGVLEGGHYVAYVKRRGTWYLCDDASVEPVSQERVLAAQAFMLFYDECMYNDNECICRVSK